MYSIAVYIVSVVCYDHLELTLSAQKVLNVIMGDGMLKIWSQKLTNPQGAEDFVMQFMSHCKLKS